MLALVWTMLPAAVLAQPAGTGFTGFATLFVGGAHGGDVRGTGWTPGISVAVLDASGFGAEVDLSHVRSFDNERFAESGITTLTFNAVGMWPRPEALLRPYVLGGLGLLRVRACVPECQPVVSRTDWAMDAGGGAYVVLNEVVGVRGDIRYFRYLQRHADVPLTDNGFFDFWRTSVGVVVSWPIR
jgi:hypothetical protein